MRGEKRVLHFGWGDRFVVGEGAAEASTFAADGGVAGGIGQVRRVRLERWARMVAGVAGLMLPNPAGAATCPSGRVVDASGAGVAGAVVLREGDGGIVERVTTGLAGRFAFACTGGMNGAAAGMLRVTAAGVESAPVAVSGQGEMVLVARPTAVAEQVTVTTTRSGVALGPQAETVVALDAGAAAAVSGADAR